MAGILRDDEPFSEINVTPFIDVMLVLLVIFMVTATIIVNPVIAVKLPEASTADNNSLEEAVVTVLASGAYRIGGRPVEAEALPMEIRALLDRATRKVVRIEADEAAEVGPAIRVLDACRAVGAEGALIATRPSENTSQRPETSK